jgi:hypothetical protein
MPAPSVKGFLGVGCPDGAQSLLALTLITITAGTALAIAEGCKVDIFALLQALSYSQGSKTRYLVRLQLHEPASSSLPALLQLKEGKAAAEAAARAALAEAEHHDIEPSVPAHSRRSNGSDNDSDDEHRGGTAKLTPRARGPPEPLESL